MGGGKKLGVGWNIDLYNMQVMHTYANTPLHYILNNTVIYK